MPTISQASTRFAHNAGQTMRVEQPELEVAKSKVAVNNEVDRQSDIAHLNNRVTLLEWKGMDMEKLIVFRALATALQFTICRKFGDMITSKYAYTTTFDHVRDMVTDKKENAQRKKVYQHIVQLFAEEGVEEEDITKAIKVIHEAGTYSNHPVMIEDSSGIFHHPDVAEIGKMIAEAPVEVTLRSDAARLLRILAQLRDPKLPLLATTQDAK